MGYTDEGSSQLKKELRHWSFRPVTVKNLDVRDFDINTATRHVVFLPVRWGGADLKTVSSLWGCGMLGLGLCLQLMADVFRNKERTLTSETNPALIHVTVPSVPQQDKSLWAIVYNMSPLGKVAQYCNTLVICSWGKSKTLLPLHYDTRKFSPYFVKKN